MEKNFNESSSQREDMTRKMTVRPEEWPEWADGKTIDERPFCAEFLRENTLVFAEDSFFSPEGKVIDLDSLRARIVKKIEPYLRSGIAGKSEALLNLLHRKAYVSDLPPQEDRIHVANGTLFLDGRFIQEKKEAVRSRLPVSYRPDAAKPEQWLRFLDQLLYPEDIPTLQEFMGYCLIPSNKGQRMLLIKGRGGEGKSQIGVVLSRLLGAYAKSGNISKIAVNRFALAGLEHVLLLINDDMSLEQLKKTDVFKTMITSQGKMDLEKKGVQSYQGYMYARIIAFSNGDLTALNDHSDGFYRRQLILETQRRPAERIDDPYLADKMFGDLEGIFLWAFEGLQRLLKNSFHFTESDRAKANLEAVRRGDCNVVQFLEASDFIRRGAGLSIPSKDLLDCYHLWCKANAEEPMTDKKALHFLSVNHERFGIEHTNTVINGTGQRVRGFKGIGLAGAQPVLPFRCA